jgi:RND family efflux transporter MFP subunit
MPASKSPFAILSAILLTAAISGCNNTKEHQDPRTVPELVRVATVAHAQEDDRSFTGVVTARVQSDLGFRVPGKLTKRLVEVGQTVRVGQPLMRIDVTDYAHVITTQTQNVEAAKAKAAQTAADEARYRGLVSTGAISASAYDQVKAAADAAKAQLASVEAQALVAKDEGDYSLLVADADGTIIETLAEPGQVVAAGQTVVKLAHAGPREAAIYLPETVRPKIGLVARASLYSENGSSRARLRQLSEAADPATRTFEARFVLTEAAANAPLGETVTIELPTPDRISRSEVPLGAVSDRGKGPGVWVLNEKSSTVSFRQVNVLRLEAEDAILSGGVQPGERIVALGTHLLSEGQQVRVEDQRAAIR